MTKNRSPRAATNSSSISYRATSKRTSTVSSSNRTKRRRFSRSRSAITTTTSIISAAWKTKTPSRAEETEYAKQNVILVGPTGVGKTYLIKHIAELIKVPFVKADATKFSETGYVGGDVEDLVRELVQKADGDVALAQFGIIYIDEIDKIGVGFQYGRTRRQRTRRPNHAA